MEQQDSDKSTRRVPPFDGHAARKRAPRYLSRATARIERWHAVRKTPTVALTIAEIDGLGQEGKGRIDVIDTGHCRKYRTRSPVSEIEAVGWWT